MKYLFSGGGSRRFWLTWLLNPLDDVRGVTDNKRRLQQRVTAAIGEVMIKLVSDSQWLNATDGEAWAQRDPLRTAERSPTVETAKLIIHCVVPGRG